MWLYWVHPITQNNLCNFKSLNPLPCKATYSQILGIRTGTSLRDIFPSIQTTLLNGNPKSLNQADRAKVKTWGLPLLYIILIFLKNHIVKQTVWEHSWQRESILKDLPPWGLQWYHSVAQERVNEWVAAKRWLAWLSSTFRIQWPLINYLVLLHKLSVKPRGSRYFSCSQEA